MNSNSKIKKNGFTIIEFLVVMAILFILVGLSSLIINSFRKEKNLETTTAEIIENLKLAQSKTLASEGASSFGVNFETDKFTLFKGTVFNPAAPDNEGHVLSGDLTISEINLNNSSSAVVFERLTGFTNNNGQVRIELVSDSSKNKTIFIDPSGAIALSSTLPDDTSRLKDSRHVHVFFSQNTKNAAILSLTFPNDGYSELINYQDYLDGGKTQFGWEGIVNVSGVNQSLKIHSHQLTDTETLFCIHRDRRFNSKALNIFLDGENLINYTATGTTTQGTSFWVGAPEIQ